MPAPCLASQPSCSPFTCRILVVEADQAPEHSIALALMEEGFEVERSASAEAAAARLELEGVDLVVATADSDPSGMAWIGHMCARHPTIPVVVLGSTEPLGGLVPLPSSGGDRPPGQAARSVLALPGNADQLQRAIERASTRRRLRRFNTRALLFEEALDRIYLVYQPVIRVRSGCTVAYEALLRVSDPRFPGAEPLLALAKELRRQDDLDDRSRFALAREIEEESPHRCFFLNLHMDELRRGVLGTQRDPLAPHAPRIILEFGHDLDLPEGRAVRETLARVRSLGYRIAVGDHAMSTADLYRLRVLEPDIYKLGTRAIHRCDTDAAKRAAIHRMVELAHAEGALVVAQGIERPGERDVASDLGCDLLQGFLIGLPSARF